MINNNEFKTEKTFNLKEVKTFLKACKGHRFEVFYKLILAYNLSRPELLYLEWNDIDFHHNTIKICPVSVIKNNKFYYSWNFTKHFELARNLPLLPSIKKLLFELKDKQETNEIQNPNYDTKNMNYVCLKDDGTRLNINTLSRNLRHIAGDNNLPAILLSGLRMSLDDFVCKEAQDYDYYRAWTRFDITQKGQIIYGDLNLKRNKHFLNKLDGMISGEQNRKSDMEM